MKIPFFFVLLLSFGLSAVDSTFPKEDLRKVVVSLQKYCSASIVLEGMNAVSALANPANTASQSAQLIFLRKACTNIKKCSLFAIENPNNRIVAAVLNSAQNALMALHDHSEIDFSKLPEIFEQDETLEVFNLLEECHRSFLQAFLKNEEMNQDLSLENKDDDKETKFGDFEEERAQKKEEQKFLDSQNSKNNK